MGPPQEFTKFRFWSSCLGDDLNVTRCPSSCFMKTLCLESTLHIMLSRPIWPCIRKKGWTAGILSMLQLTRSNHGLQWWASCLVIWCGENLGFLTDGQGKLGESDISHSTCQLSIQIFSAWLKTKKKLSATPVSSLACLCCTHILQQRFPVLTSATSNSLVTSFCPDLDPLHCQSLSMFQLVVERVLTLMPPTTKSASLGFITWQAKIDKLTIMKCLLFASGKARTTHSLAGYTHQTVKRHGVVVRAHLDFTSSE